MTNLFSFIKKLAEGLGALFFPNNCLNCGNALSFSSSILCRKCEAELPSTNYENDENNPVFQSFWGRASIEFASSAYFFRKGEKLQHLIHLLKYRNRPDVGVYLGTLVGRSILKSSKYNNIDYLVPVPLHPKRHRMRGYNQSEKLAQGISEVTEIEILTDVLIRNKYNVTQTSKGHYERWENVDGIFDVRFKDMIVNKNVLLVDDIITTGSTLEACASALNQIDGVKVYILTAGYTSTK